MAAINEVSGSPLKGFVVLDFTWVVAGPQCTRLLADWGADVYRIEWPQNPDMIRFMGAIPGAKTHEDVFERSGFYNDLNSSKTGVTLNMNSEGGRALFRELLTKADAVIENFSPAAMEKWGFDYEAMRKINPKIIYMSVSGYGHSGPSQYYLTFGPSAQALNGLTYA
jgi:crotonobetainyl-CoA:carnitine CoA-transferase CaiB-like acyl-CoA transferase